MAPLQDNDKYIGELLVKDGIITPQDLDRGLFEQKKRREFLCSTLVNLGLASEEKIFSILSLQIGIPYVSLKDFKADPIAINRIPGVFAKACKCLPLKIAEDVFYIAMTDPLNSVAVEEIKAYLGIDNLRIFLSGDSDILDAIHRYYGV